MDKEITIYDIARLLGISPATVSRALNDHPAINVKTKQTIANKAKELGYRSNTFASNLRRRNTSTLGVIVPRLNSNFMSTVLAGMEAEANDSGYNLLISQSLESSKKEKANAKTMYNSRVDGLLVSVAYDTDSFEHFENFVDKKIPMIFFDRVMEHNHSISIIIDNELACYEATAHMISQGCRRIMHVTGNLKRNVYSERLAGYKRAITEAGLSVDDNLILVGDLSQEAGAQAAATIDAMTNRPDGVFLANDLCAVTCMRHLKGKGYRVPEDIAVVGFNNDPVSEVVEPNLTTVYYPGREMGALAVKTMILHLTGQEKMQQGITMQLPSKLIIRNSSLKRGPSV